MLRNSYLLKYNTNDKSMEMDCKFNKEEGEDFLNKNRPLSHNKVSHLPKNTLFHFMDDFLVNKKIANLLYSSNSEREMKHLIHSLNVIKNSTNSKHNKSTLLSHKKKQNSIINTKERNSQISFIQKEIETTKLNKSLQKEKLSNKSNKIFYLIKKQKKDNIKLHYKPLNDIRLRNYNRTLNKCMSQVMTNKNFKLPSVGININNVYSRLYHNEVYIGAKDSNKTIDYMSNSYNSLYNSENSSLIQTNNNNNEINKSLCKSLTLKNAIKSRNGKEFTIKINNNVIKKCLLKYSGGPKSNLNKKVQYGGKEKDKNKNILRMEKLKDEFGNTNLHNAIKKNSREFVRYFLEKKMNPNEPNKLGDTPLHMAMRVNDIEIIKMLLEAGGNITLRNKDQQRPYDLATYSVKSKFKLELKMMELGEPI